LLPEGKRRAATPKRKIEEAPLEDGTIEERRGKGRGKLLRNGFMLPKNAREEFFEMSTPRRSKGFRRVRKRLDVFTQKRRAA